MMWHEFGVLRILVTIMRMVRLDFVFWLDKIFYIIFLF